MKVVVDEMPVACGACFFLKFQPAVRQCECSLSSRPVSSNMTFRDSECPLVPLRVAIGQDFKENH